MKPSHEERRLATTLAAIASLLVACAQAPGPQRDSSPAGASATSVAAGELRLAQAKQLEAQAREVARKGNLGAALPLREQALALREAALGPDHPDIGTALNNLSELNRELGRFPQAIALTQRHLALVEKTQGSENVDFATSLGNLALSHQQMGQVQLAMPIYQRSLAIRERLLGTNSLDVANSLNNIAELHRATGAFDQAEPLYERALVIVQATLGPEHPVAATILSSQAAIHMARGRFDRALPLAQRSVSVREKALGPEHPELAVGLNNLAEVYRGLGQDDETRPLLERSLAIFEKQLGPDHPNVAMALNGLGGLDESEGKYERALPRLERSFSIVEKQFGPGHPYVATSLNNIAAVYQSAGQMDRALEANRRAFAIRERFYGRNHPELAGSLNNLGVLYMSMGQTPKALAEFQKAIAIAQTTPAAREVLWKSQSGASQAYAALGQRGVAIVWGKEAVNTLQSIRVNLMTLDSALQRSYLASNRNAYDWLADMLIAEGRIAEAQDVLQMLKEQELHDSLQRADPTDPRLTRLAPTDRERTLFGPYQDLRDRQAALGAERAALDRKVRAGTLTVEDGTRRQELVERAIPVALEAMNTFFRQLEADLGSTASGSSVQVESSRLRTAVSSLARSEARARAVGVQYLVTEDRLSIVLTVPDAPPIAYQLPVRRKQLYDQIAALQLVLSNPGAGTASAQGMLQRLHGWLIAPIRSDLRKAHARTLMLSLDDQLRLVPFAALMDEGGRYLVRDYTVSLYNEAARQQLDRPGGQPWRVAALGLSEAVENLPALRAVPKELTGVVGAPGVSGDAYLNGRFDRERFMSVLGPQGKTAASAPGDARRYNVLHVASHFVLQAGQASESRLYLGDKSRLTLADIARDDLRFGNFELVTFSACETGRGGGRDARGQEMESLGAKTQNQGARAVMATLWKVTDDSTGAFMERFYGSRGGLRLNKASALREAQLAMLDGKLRPAGGQSWSSPYYWAPFVLMGNWR